MTADKPVRRRKVLGPNFSLTDTTPPTATPPAAPAQDPHVPAAAQGAPPQDGRTPPSASPAARPPARSGMSDLHTYVSKKDGTDNTDDLDGDDDLSVRMSDLVTPRVDPDLDLVALGAYVPRYFKSVLRTASFMTGRSQQDIVTDALRAHLPANLLAKARRGAAGQ